MNHEAYASAPGHVLITGAASGIGRACAEKMQVQGSKLCAFDIVEPDFEIDSFFRLDLADPQSIEGACAFARSQAPFDALLNIAGVPPKPGQQEQVLKINWLGQVQLTQGLLSSLRAGGSIVNMASKAGGGWHENLSQIRELLAVRSTQQLSAFLDASGIDATRAYNLSKEAIIVWTMASAKALKERGLRMNSVSPAAVDTAILGDFKAAFGPVVDKNLALIGRAGKPEEIAEVAVFLASAESQWLHGIDITVDGGMGAMIQTGLLELDGLGVAAARDE